MKNNPVIRAVFRFIALFAVYLAVSLPFKAMQVIPGFTDVRPVALFAPVYAIFFGPNGCLAFAAGNLVSDIFSDSLRWSSVAGFIANFGGPLLIWLYWTRISKTGFSLKTLKSMGVYMAVNSAAVAFMLILIVPSVALVYDHVDIPLLTMTIAANNILFMVMPGIPLMILLNEELGFKPYSKISQTAKF